MRICFIGSKSPHTQHWAEHFATRGHEVHLITNGVVDYKYVTDHQIKPTPSRALFLSRAITVRRLINLISPDVVHAHQLNPYGLYAVLSGAHPVIVSSWGSDIANQPDRSFIWRHLAKYVLKHADIVHVQDKLCEQRVNELVGTAKNVRVVPWGVDTNKFYPGDTHRTSDKKIITIIGGGARKDDTLLKMVSDISLNVDEDVVIRVVGYPIPHPELKHFPNVDFVGRVPVSSLPDMLRGSDIYIDPYFPEAADEIGHTYGMSLLEAMACGVPTIAANRPTVAMLPNWYHGGVFDAYSDVIDVSSVITDILTDDKTGASMTRNNLESVAHRFDWNRNMKLVEKMYGDIVPQPKPL